MRNLFLSTDRSVVRKAVEFSIVPLTEGIVAKERILELYLNIVERGRRSTARKQRRDITLGAFANRIIREQAVQVAR